MFKSFIAGLVLGLAGAGTIIYYAPVVDQVREQSLIVVHANHGNTETFYVNVPSDRILVGARDELDPVPPGVDWPADEKFASSRTELFKLRNSKDAVVGVASRIAASDPVSGDIIEWVFHLPARGSVYVTMEPDARDGGYRVGELQAGTREFEKLRGQVTEQWIADTTGLEDARGGQIQLITAFVGQEFEE